VRCQVSGEAWQRLIAADAKEMDVKYKGSSEGGLSVPSALC
jgi:hypothetical protein